MRIRCKLDATGPVEDIYIEKTHLTSAAIFILGRSHWFFLEDQYAPQHSPIAPSANTRETLSPVSESRIYFSLSH